MNPLPSALRPPPSDPQLAPLLLSTDFDGTLIDHQSPVPMAEAFFAWINETRRHRRVVWAVNTGRDWDSLREELDRRKAPFLPDWVMLIEREVHRVHNGSLIGHREWNRRCFDVHAELFQRADAMIEQMRRDLAKFKGLQIIRDVGSPLGLIATDDEQASAVHEALEPLYQAHPDLHAVRNSVYLRFAHIDFHKGSCLALVQSEEGIAAENTIAAGDNLNDLPMLQRRYAHHLICPSNSLPEVKDQVLAEGGFVASQPADQGVVEGLRALILQPLSD
ncbi:MAG: HAD family hydrolase [Candidatus Methylacidiphilales bacterium]|nr:HAD family hydrolase [Candidatus Methylacidiphilales bacterium]